MDVYWESQIDPPAPEDRDIEAEMRALEDRVLAAELAMRVIALEKADAANA